MWPPYGKGKSNTLPIEPLSGLLLVTQRVYAITLWLFLVSCQLGENSAKTTRVVNSTITYPTELSTLPTQETTQIPTPSPTITNSPTPQPVILAVPDRWDDVAASVVEHLKQSDSRWQWQLLTEDVSVEMVAQGLVDIALVPEEGGIPAGQRPLVLAVPFSTDWESITLTEAQEILEQGSPFVAVMDWADMPHTLKALRIDDRRPSDADYPILQIWSLVTAPGFEAAAYLLGSYLDPALSADAIVHIAAVGDVMLDRALGESLRAGELGYPFAETTELLSPADLTVGNLESALGDQGTPANKGYTFRAPLEALPALAMAGFDVLSLANNHALDYGSTALLQGIDLLNENGIATLGAGADEKAAHQPFIQDINGIALAFLAYVNVPVEYRGFDTRTWIATENQPGMAWAEPARIQADIESVRNQVDLVIVLLHSGHENVSLPSPPQVAAARAAIDAGAHLVIGHHAHILQGIEFYNQGVIAYGLGNFAFEDGGPPQSAILNIWVDHDGVRELEIIPIMLEGDGRPRLATEMEADAIRASIYIQTTEVSQP